MINEIATIAVLAATLFSSCKEAPKEETGKQTTIEITEKETDDIVTSSSTDKDGNTLEMTFNNTKGTATVNFNKETIELVQQKAASGIWYKNDHYELRGKGNDIELKHDNQVIFTHKDDVVRTSITNKEGRTLDMTFNNTENIVKVYLNGGEEIELMGQKAASGIWYKNDHYELRGKGENLKLTKDGKTVFENEALIE